MEQIDSTNWANCSSQTTVVKIALEEMMKIQQTTLLGNKGSNNHNKKYLMSYLSEDELFSTLVFTKALQLLDTSDLVLRLLKLWLNL